MAGTVSNRATTTIKVAHRDEFDPDTYFMLIADALRDQGYVPRELMMIRDVKEWMRDMTGELVHLAGGFEVGTVVERRGDLLNVRRSVLWEAS